MRSVIEAGDDMPTPDQTSSITSAAMSEGWERRETEADIAYARRPDGHLKDIRRFAAYELRLLVAELDRCALDQRPDVERAIEQLREVIVGLRGPRRP